MGGLEAEGAVRYVSPVTARLFSKEGSAALGLPGEVLVPLEEASPVWGRHRPTTSQQIPQQQRGIMTTNPQGGGDGAFIINSAYHQSAPMHDEDETSPQSCFEAILTERVSISHALSSSFQISSYTTTIRKAYAAYVMEGTD